MARPLRVEFDGALYHVTSRGNARDDIFEGRLTKTKRDGRIVRAVYRYSYSQRGVADFLDLHYATVSRLANRL
jgi:hypothetical protein